MAKTHKKQHIVPRCYTAAWTDPDTPEGWDPYVWTWTKLGTRPERKAPANLFTQTDMYTVMDGRQRLLHLEHGLKQLEDHFARIRRTALTNGSDLIDEDRIYLSAFTAALFLRTTRLKRHHQQQFGIFAGRMRALENKHRSDGGPPSADVAFAQAVADQPFGLLLPQALETLTPIYARRNFSFMRAPDGIHFVTSDNPVSMHDPAWKPGGIFGMAPGSPTTQIIMPISPRLCMLITSDLRDGYFDASTAFVQHVNSQTRARCEEQYVSTTGEMDGGLFLPLPGFGGGRG